MFITVNLVIFGKVILQFALNFINFSNAAIIILLFSRWIVSFIALYVTAYLNYFLLPAWQGSDKLKSKSSFPGTLFFCLCWMLGSWCFSIYINNLHTYNRVYGSIGAFVMLNHSFCLLFVCDTSPHCKKSRPDINPLYQGIPMAGTTRMPRFVFINRS